MIQIITVFGEDDYVEKILQKNSTIPISGETIVKIASKVTFQIRSPNIEYERTNLLFVTNEP